MLKIQKNYVWTLIASGLSYFTLWLLIFPVTEWIREYFSDFLGVTSVNENAFLDAVITFAILLTFFYAILLVKKTHAAFVVIVTAFLLFLYWGFESKFFWNGLNPMYPVWYEINMALNDITAALLAIFIHKRITNSSIRRSPITTRAD